MAKTFDGKIEQYYPSGGTEFVDGSLRADIPLREMAALFNANKFIVSQVNPHVTPFIGSQGEGTCVECLSVPMCM